MESIEFNKNNENKGKIYKLQDFIKYFSFYIIISLFVLMMTNHTAAIGLLDISYGTLFIIIFIIILLIFFVYQKKKGNTHISLNKIVLFLVLLIQLAMYASNWFVREKGHYLILDEVLEDISIGLRLVYVIAIFMLLFTSKSIKKSIPIQIGATDLSLKQSKVGKTVRLFLLIVAVFFGGIIFFNFLGPLLGFMGSFIMLVVVAVMAYFAQVVYNFFKKNTSFSISLIITIFLSLLFVVVSFFIIYFNRKVLDYFYFKIIGMDRLFQFEEENTMINKKKLNHQKNNLNNINVCANQNPIYLFIKEFKKSNYLVRINLETEKKDHKLYKYKKGAFYYEKGKLVRSDAPGGKFYEIMKNGKIFIVSDQEKSFFVSDINATDNKKVNNYVQQARSMAILPDIINYYNQNKCHWKKMVIFTS